MHERHCTLVLFLTSIITSTLMSVALGDDWDQYTVASIGGIDSSTRLSAPDGTPDTRTTIGIAEVVDLEIDTATWSDCDCNLTTNQIEDDTLGTITWSVTGKGDISTTTGNSTVLTARDTPGSTTVEADITDSGNKYDDPTITKSKGFTVKAPNDETGVHHSDPGCGTVGNDEIGHKSKFTVTVLPTSVNFHNVSFREDIDEASWTWPDGTNDAWPVGGGQFPFTVDTNNKSLHTYGFCGDPIGRIHDGNGYVNFDFHIMIDVQYKNESGTWVDYNTVDRTNEYRGSDQKSRTLFDSAQGGWQGPWQQ